jgi:LPS export ABC transporter protein LptC
MAESMRIPVRSIATAVAIFLLAPGCGAPDLADAGPDACEVLPGPEPVAVGPQPETRGVVRQDVPPEYVIHADSGSAHPRAGTVSLCGVRLLVHDSVGERVAEVTAATGEYDRATGALTARGDVIVVLPRDGRRLETEELHYEPRADRVWSPGPSSFYREGMTVQGESFTADRRFENVVVQRPTGAVTW